MHAYMQSLILQTRAPLLNIKSFFFLFKHKRAIALSDMFSLGDLQSANLSAAYNSPQQIHCFHLFSLFSKMETTLLNKM